jgi:hypothetical protein
MNSISASQTTSTKKRFPNPLSTKGILNLTKQSINISGPI